MAASGFAAITGDGTGKKVVPQGVPRRRSRNKDSGIDIGWTALNSGARRYNRVMKFAFGLRTIAS